MAASDAIIQLVVITVDRGDAHASEAVVEKGQRFETWVPYFSVFA